MGHRLGTGQPTTISYSHGQFKKKQKNNLEILKTDLRIIKKWYLTYIKSTKYSNSGCNLEGQSN